MFEDLVATSLPPMQSAYLQLLSNLAGGENYASEKEEKKQQQKHYTCIRTVEQ